MESRLLAALRRHACIRRLVGPEASAGVGAKTSVEESGDARSRLIEAGTQSREPTADASAPTYSHPDQRPFPSGFYRGLRKPLKNEGPDWEHFKPVEGQRADGWADASINWNDDDGAKGTTLGDITNAKFGAVLVPTTALEIYSEILELTRGKFKAERRSITGKNPNTYHGNLLFSPELKRPLAYKAICNHLALMAEVIPASSTNPDGS